MSNTLVNILSRLGMRFAIGMTYAYACLLVLITSQSLEHEFLPIVKDFTVLTTEHFNDKVIISGTFNKVRDCRFIEITAYSGDRLAMLAYNDTADHVVRSRARGFQEFGPWVIQPDNKKPLTIEARHKCHILWDSTSDLIGDLGVGFN